MIKPKPLRPAVDGGFTLDDFTVDEAGGTVTCPAGHSRPMSPKRTVTFGRVCAGCPLRSRCTTAQDGRSMTIHPHEELLRAARARARTPQFKQDYPTRSTVERIIAWAATEERPSSQAPIPRRPQERRLAPDPMCIDEPAHPRQQRPHP
ncbi:transposase [Rhodococcus koreensis]|uniref:transposase n=1 Tax=Rhodococcus koreensis TaxID=99653 RepID=UPI0009F5D3A1|nr:transposase [Rhodococcus koreensis]QSE84811.1 transposase [Rhodococcus koreensis]